MAGSYLTSRQESADSHIQQLEHYEGVSALIKSLKKLYHKLEKNDPASCHPHQHTLVRIELARQPQ